MNTINQQKFNTNQHRQNAPKNQQNNPAFKGFWNSAYKFLADEPVWGATLVDIGAMVVPRTWTDMRKRGFNAGFETGFRESESSLNDALVGVYGVGAGALISGAINKKYGVKAQKIFASTDAGNVYTAKWEQHKGNVDSYVRDIVDNIEAYNPNSSRADKKGYVRVPDEHKQGIIDDLKYVADGESKTMSERWQSVKKRLSAKMLDATGVEDGLRLTHKNGAEKKVTVSNTKALLDNFYNMTKAFKSDKVGENASKFLADYHKFGKSRTAIGVAIAGIFAVIAQPLNVYLSKKRTGTDGFVGVEGRKKDNSLGFKALKLASGLGMMGIALASMGAIPKNIKNFKQIPKLFIEKNQYKGKNPTINQFKTVFGLAIASRLFTARDRDEHREVVIKDVLGFFNWLILGNIFNKLIIHKFQSKGAGLLKRAPLDKNAGFWKRTSNFLQSSIATHSEVAAKGLKKETGIASLIKADGKAMTFTEMFKALPKNGQTRKSLRLLNWAQLGGYLYSALVLGIGIPNLNIYLTNLSDKHKKSKLDKLKQTQDPHTPVLHSMKMANKQIDKTVFRQLKHDAEH